MVTCLFKISTKFADFYIYDERFHRSLLKEENLNERVTIVMTYLSITCSCIIFYKCGYRSNFRKKSYCENNNLSRAIVVIIICFS